MLVPSAASVPVNAASVRFENLSKISNVPDKYSVAGGRFRGRLQACEVWLNLVNKSAFNEKACATGVKQPSCHCTGQFQHKTSEINSSQNMTAKRTKG